MKSRQASFFLYWPVENEDDSLISSDESAFHMRGKNRHMKQQKVLINKMKLNVMNVYHLTAFGNLPVKRTVS